MIIKIIILKNHVKKHVKLKQILYHREILIKQDYICLLIYFLNFIVKNNIFIMYLFNISCSELYSFYFYERINRKYYFI